MQAEEGGREGGRRRRRKKKRRGCRADRGLGRLGWGYKSGGGGGSNEGVGGGGGGGGLLMMSPMDSYIKRGRLNNRGDVNDIRTADPGH